MTDPLHDALDALKERRAVIDEAIATIERVVGVDESKPAPAKRGRGAGALVNAAPAIAAEPDIASRALVVVRKAGRKGLIGSALLHGVDAPPAFGLGSVKAAIQDGLRRAGASELIDECLREERRGRGFMWYAGDRIDDAIVALHAAEA